MENKHLVWIDVLNIVACAGVLLQHCTNSQVHGFSGTPSLDWYIGLTTHSFFLWPVDVFFMISGFTLVRISILTNNNNSGGDKTVLRQKTEASGYSATCVERLVHGAIFCKDIHRWWRCIANNWNTDEILPVWLQRLHVVFRTVNIDLPLVAVLRSVCAQLRQAAASAVPYNGFGSWLYSSAKCHIHDTQRTVWHLYHGVTLLVLYRCRILYRQLWHIKENTKKAVRLCCRKWNNNVCGDNVSDIIFSGALQIFSVLHKHSLHYYGNGSVHLFQIPWLE